MKSFNRITIGLIAIFVAVCAALPAYAISKVTTVESKVQVVPSVTSSGETAYRIVGPERVEYRITGPSSEIDRLATFLRENPDATIQFNGEVNETGTEKVFNIAKWNRVQTTTTTRTRDGMGRETVETETRTETINR